MHAKNVLISVYNNVLTISKNRNESYTISRIILKHFFNIDSLNILKNDEILIDNDNFENTCKQTFERLKKNEPIQYITGECEFFKCRIKVDKSVFIPRQETEEMVASIMEKDLNNKKIIDLCTGSGCIAISIKNKFKNAEVFALDIDKNALKIASENAKINNCKINLIEHDIFKNSENIIPESDVLISNPPYVCENEKIFMKENVINYEPHTAIFVENEDPLKFYKKIKDLIRKKLNNNGSFFLEINERFGNDILELFSDLNLKFLEINKDINAKDRWISGQKYD